MRNALDIAVSAALSGALSWFFTWLYYRRQMKENAPILSAVNEIRSKLVTGAFTKDEAAREIIKALETGALSGADIESSNPFWPYKFCPDCGGPVDETDAYETPDGGGYTLRCRKCPWHKELAV